MRDDFPLPDLDVGADRARVLGRRGPRRAADPALRRVRPAAAGTRTTDVPRTAAARRSRGTSMSGRGTLFSWVVVTHPFLPQFADLVPFVPALVALDEDPAVRVPTRMVDCEPGDLDFEMPVQVTFRPISFTGVDGEVDGAAVRPGTMTTARPRLRHGSLRRGRARLVRQQPGWRDPDRDRRPALGPAERPAAVRRRGGAARRRGRLRVRPRPGARA